MLTRRDLAIAVASVCLTLGAVGLTYSLGPILGTSVFNWNDLETESATFGTVRSYFGGPTSTLLDLEMRAVTLDPGAMPHPPRPHEMSQEELIIVKEGTIEVELQNIRYIGSAPDADWANNKTQQLGPGSALFLAPNQWHEIRNTGQDPATYYVIEWRSPGMGGR